MKTYIQNMKEFTIRNFLELINNNITAAGYNISICLLLFYEPTIKNKT